MIWGLYTTFLDAGYSPQLFWQLSIGEVNDLLESYIRQQDGKQKKREAENKDQIMMLYTQALQIANMLGAMMDSKHVQMQPLRYYYPYLFGEEEEAIEDTGEQTDKPKLSPEMRLHKARMDDFAFRHNRAFREKQKKQEGEQDGRNDSGEAPGDHTGSDI
ncbi:MAG: hypothetical protein LUD50_04675 [Clostridia bacterium]|nr:hypothetical protein [Clostridia bacterium]